MLAPSSRLTLVVGRGKAEAPGRVGVLIRVISTTGITGDCDSEDEDPDELVVFPRHAIV